jgi:hypothetical protein
MLRHTSPSRTILRGTVPGWALSKLRSQGNRCPPHALPRREQNPSPHQKRGRARKRMETDGRTDSELIYWIPKYILMRNNKPFSHMGHMSVKMQALTESQDKIGWRNFTEGYISCHFYKIQRFHLSMSSSYLNGSNWTKIFISKILQITHSQ